MQAEERFNAGRAAAKRLSDVYANGTDGRIVFRSPSTGRELTVSMTQNEALALGLELLGSVKLKEHVEREKDGARKTMLEASRALDESVSRDEPAIARQRTMDYWYAKGRYETLGEVLIWLKEGA
jgi:hypothetical protein